MLFFKREARVRNVGYDLSNFLMMDLEGLNYRVEVRKCQLMPWEYLKTPMGLPMGFKTFNDALVASEEWVGE